MKTIVMTLVLSTLFTMTLMAQLPDLKPQKDRFNERVALNEKKTNPVLLNRPALFQGGNRAMIQFIQKNLVYPEVGREYGKEGIIIASFTIDENGKITKAYIKRGLGGEFDEAVLAMIEKMPNWNPAVRLGTRVSSNYTLPLRFALQ